MYSFKSTKWNDFVYLTSDQLEGEQIIPSDEIESGKVEIKIRPRTKNQFNEIILANPNANVSKGSRRTKERKIGQVI